MTTITILSPDHVTSISNRVGLAARTSLTNDAHLAVIDNGKPRAGDLLRYLADELRDKGIVGTYEIYTKPSAAKPIDQEEAVRLAARSHLIVTGVGD